MGLTSINTRLRRLAREERGFTLLELLLVAGMLAVILTATLALLDTSTRMAPRDQERGQVIREAQTGLHRMTRELRQTYEIGSLTPTSMEAHVLTNAGPERVTYDCGVEHPSDSELKRCVRYGQGGTQEIVVDRIKSAVLTYEGNPTTFAQVKLVVPARGSLEDGHSHDVVLTDGFYMRNRDVAG